MRTCGVCGAATAPRWRYCGDECARAARAAKDRTRHIARRNDPAKRVRDAERRRARRADPAVAAVRRERYAQWAAANPDVKHNSRAAYRARQRAAVVEYVDRRVVWERDSGVCHICELDADSDDWHLDHIIPLARGGDHSYANTAVSHPACNIRKGDRMPA